MTKLKIAFVDTIGLEYDGNTLKERGLGGSESAVISMARELVKIGFDVEVYNNCKEAVNVEGVRYYSVKNITYDDISFRSYPDIAIAVRDPHVFMNPGALNSYVMKANLRTLWLHDTFTPRDVELESFVVNGIIHELWTLSDFHTNYILNCDHGRKRQYEALKNKIFMTRNGVNDWGVKVDISKKDKDLYVFNAAFNKGLKVLLDKVWPEVKRNIPSAKLVVIGGFYKFEDGKIDQQQQDWLVYKDKYESSDLHFTGIIPQNEVAEWLASASFTIYPTEFPETFSISALESLYYNTPVITQNFGALEETALEGACYKGDYSTTPNAVYPNVNTDDQVRKFVDKVILARANEYLYKQKANYCDIIKDIAKWDTVAVQWKQHIYRKLGLYLDVGYQRDAKKINDRVRKIFGRKFTNIEDVVASRSYFTSQINVIVTVRNAENYIGKCLESIQAQNYDKIRIWICDDASTDNTVKIIQEYRDSLNAKVYYTQFNDERKGALRNQYEMMQHIPGGEIVIILDGDDWLFNDPDIFTRINTMYVEESVEFTYGSCWSVADNIPLIAQDYPQKIKENYDYRNHKFAWGIPYTHLRTFKSGLIKGIDVSRLKDDNGDFFMSGGDVALFYEMIERVDYWAVRAVKDVVMYYNDANPNNDFRINGEEQNRNALMATITEVTELPKKILIAVPTAKYIESETMKSIYDLDVPDNFETELQFFYGYNIDQIRNLIADYAILGFHDYVLFVDSDIVLPKDTLTKLLAHKKPIVGGIYRQRKEELVLEVFDSNYAHIKNPESFVLNNPGLVGVGAVGFGCTLVNTKVLRSMGYPYFVYKQGRTFAETISEDVMFCKKAAEKGNAVYVDTSLICQHIGQKKFIV